MNPILVLLLLLLISISSINAFFSIPAKRPSQRLFAGVKFNFHDARKLARARGHDNIDEFLKYDCPGAYRITKSPDVDYADEFISWEDFLGIIYTFDEARKRIADMRIDSVDDYKDRRSRDVDIRFPALPELKYKSEWRGWQHFLSYNIDSDDSDNGGDNDGNKNTDGNDPREHFMYCHI